MTGPAEATEWGDVVMILAPDTALPKLYREQVQPHLSKGKTLMFAHGFNIRRGTIEPSDTAEHGDYTGGDRLVGEATRAEMRKMLEEVRNGTYAKGWIAENQAGRPWFDERRGAERQHQIEEVGARLRALIPFLDPVTVTPEGEFRAAQAQKKVTR